MDDLDRLTRLAAALPDMQLAYSLPHFAPAVDLSESTTRLAIARSELIPVYPARRKPIITRSEGERWLASLPQEPTRRDGGRR